MYSDPPIFYILGVIFLFIILFFVYIRLKYPFWALQPVFHFYDWYYWVVNVGIIRPELPEKNKYVNLKKIKTLPFEEVDELTRKEFESSIKIHYFVNKENKYAPTLDNILPYFVGHSMPTYWSFYSEPELFLDSKTNKTITNSKIIGLITSRPLHVKIKRATFDVYYVDYLCVHKPWRKKGIAPQLIQTHEYNQSHNNRNICVSLFKREDELTGIIPLTVYKTYCFSLDKPFFATNNPKITLLTGDKQNMYYLYNFLNEQQTTWDIVIYPELSNIMELVSTNNLFVKMLVVDGEIEAVYIFRKTCTFIEKNKEILSCIASANKGITLNRDDFINGFKLALLSILEKNKQFAYLTIEDISNNTCVINHICLHLHPIVISPMAYFFYNFAYSPFSSDKCFILN